MNHTFPQPVRLAPNSTRWTPDAIHAWEQAKGITGLPPLSGLVRDRDLAERYGVCRETIWRWIKEGETAAA